MVRPLEVQKVKKITTTIKPVSVQQVKFEQPVCEGRPLPDIVATGISFFGIARPGEELRIQTGFANRGQCATGPFTVSLEVYVQIQSENYYQRLEVGKVTLHSLAPCREKNCGDGASKGITFKYQLLDKDYVYYDFTVVADYDNQVEEFIEDNNEIYKDLRVER